MQQTDTVNSAESLISSEPFLSRQTGLTLLLLKLNTGVLDDAYALCMAGKQKLVSLLQLISVYKDETEYTVLAQVITVMFSLPEKSFSHT